MPACLSRLAQLHQLLDERRPELLPTFQSQVPESWYFDPPPGRSGELMTADLGELLEAKSALVAIGEACTKRYAHGDVTPDNVVWRDSQP